MWVGNEDIKHPLLYREREMKMKSLPLFRIFLAAFLVSLLSLAFDFSASADPIVSRLPKFEPRRETAPDSQSDPEKKLATATFGTGCFWCTEAVFQYLKGVDSVESGYSGGFLKNPTYKAVCTGQTGHAEVVQIKYDPAVISFPELLEVFWRTHDPTTLNRQGADYGTQYRSVIFCHDKEQMELAVYYKKKINEAKAYRGPIVTEIADFKEFFPAENYHQDYYNLNKRQPYCRQVIGPKVSKLKRVFSDKLKTTAAVEKRPPQNERPKQATPN